jgi:hypothetical protein
LFSLAWLHILLKDNETIGFTTHSLTPMVTTSGRQFIVPTHPRPSSGKLQ